MPDGDVLLQPRPGAVPVARALVSAPGIGIPSGEQGRLFTRFFRASTAQRHAVPGVGLGLAITKAITTAHGGTLELVSAEGAAPTFTMTLPLPACPAGPLRGGAAAGPRPRPGHRPEPA